ncbi:MAG: TatD family hydrolase [Candidatus Komeilibacteria bacterium]|nr:TatD family hydrolase [Candidatus Komeilibacteria bacterium]
MLIDTHAHLNFPEYNQPGDDLPDTPDGKSWRAGTIARCLSYPMQVINIGVDYESSQEVIALAEKYPGSFFASVGLHPDDGFAKDFNIEQFSALIATHRQAVVAIGECGLDFYRWSELGSDFGKVYQKQTEIFRQQIALAREFNLPLIIHARASKDSDKPSAYSEIIKILQAENYQAGVAHCFAGTVAEAKQFLDLGFYLGFTGIITFPKGDNVREIAQMCPRDRMLIETDAPFLAPQAYRGKRNEPVYVEEVAKKIAELRSWSLGEVIELTAQNANKLFNLS